MGIVLEPFGLQNQGPTWVVLFPGACGAAVSNLMTSLPEHLGEGSRKAVMEACLGIHCLNLFWLIGWKGSLVRAGPPLLIFAQWPFWRTLFIAYIKLYITHWVGRRTGIVLYFDQKYLRSHKWYVTILIYKILFIFVFVGINNYWNEMFPCYTVLGNLKTFRI